jgi:D-glycero-alpha-D-manno-heptose-7-phosphate kinase
LFFTFNVFKRYNLATVILTRTPLRICLGGGGTDVQEYYSRFGGYVISGAIRQYIYVAIHPHFEKNIRLCYSQQEIVDSPEKVQHPVVYEAMKLFGIDEGGFEIISFADIPSNTGLGSSSSFAVGLLTALAAYQGKKMTKYDISEMACHIERELLKEPGGKQDQYIATFGGITRLVIDNQGSVTVSPLQISRRPIEELEQNIMLFFTGIKRSSPKVQNSLVQGIRKGSQTLEHLHTIKKLGLETETAFRTGNVDQYSEILENHWRAKQKLSDAISNSRVNQLYQLAMDSGAMGGKIVGAGGGGYLLLYCSDNRKRKNLKEVLSAEGLKHMDCRFDFGGASILVNDHSEVSNVVEPALI